MHLGEQLRERIATWRFQERKTVAEIDRLAGCREIHLPDVLVGPTPNQQDLAFISSLLDANPSLFLDEIQERLVETGMLKSPFNYILTQLEGRELSEDAYDDNVAVMTCGSTINKSNTATDLAPN
ncbi:hypothetical protein AZE42_05881 [Rhizopogon vesiculosus]|uniref:Uncharacterized protein n=1 Tax=Rhizopogon vesiculosus TaxID=180088 RepID=A0A1J8QXS4_9AGAM|nr:hypothetical protein AZE42_05881 [Rhizopogon vesiculosus]